MSWIIVGYSLSVFNRLSGFGVGHLHASPVQAQMSKLRILNDLFPRRHRPPSDISETGLSPDGESVVNFSPRVCFIWPLPCLEFLSLNSLEGSSNPQETQEEHYSAVQALRPSMLRRPVKPI